MRKIIFFSALILFTLAYHTVSVSGAVLHVPGQFPSLRAAIDASVAGDTVLVGDGIYSGPENRNLEVRNITVVSENGPQSCTIDCESEGCGFYVYSDYSDISVISGFTIRNAWDEWVFSGAICCGAHNAVINNCIFTDSPNIAGLCCMNATDVLITNCLIHNNNSSGFLSTISSTVLVNCTITQNTSYGAYIVDYSDARFVNCIVAQNDGYEVVDNMGSQVW
ncbi:right-handed parallel beta-helix repeat-containing protein, partial [bacterium]|nr:right-handed parallel beta-helix repeat-containing protein [bacterium]